LKGGERERERKKERERRKVGHEFFTFDFSITYTYIYDPYIILYLGLWRNVTYENYNMFPIY
jgi:hypothetical protein